MDRREFFRSGSWGLASGVGALVLSSDARPTEPSGRVEDARTFLVATDDEATNDIEIPPPAPPREFRPTEDNILGPYHRKGAPFRAKITPPLEPGDVLVVRGRVWGFDTKRPLAGAVLDVWQANAQGRYDNDDPAHPPRPGIYHNRARLMTDESGYYEYQTIRPGRYQIGQNRWRPAHIHYMIAATGYKTLVTQMYFQGDPENARDEFIKPSLIITPETVRTRHGSFQLGTFDIVLDRSKPAT